MRAVDDGLGTIHVFTGTKSNGKQFQKLMKDYRLLEQEIVDLKQEIERVKNACTEWLNKYDESENEKQTLEKEIENLKKLNNANYQSFIEVNNIINELEVFLKEGTKLATGCGITKEYIYAYENVLDKLQELKGSDKE